MTPIATKGLNKNLEAFLMLITKTEGTDRQGTPYNELFGFDNFSDYSKHPNIKRKFYNPKTKKWDFSTAAGRYQINKPTYDRLSRLTGKKDFSPATQDFLAIYLIREAGAYNDILNGRFQAAIQKTNGIWASLPGSPHEQPTAKLSDALAFLAKYSVPVISFAGIFIIATVIIILTKQ